MHKEKSVNASKREDHDLMCMDLHNRLKVWGHLEISFVFKEKQIL